MWYAICRMPARQEKLHPDGSQRRVRRGRVRQDHLLRAEVRRQTKVAICYYYHYTNELLLLLLFFL